MAMAADDGGVFLTGVTESLDFPLTPDAFRTAPVGLDGHIARLSSAGALVFSSYIGGAGTDWTRGIVQRGARVYLTGFTESATLPNALGALSGTRDGVLFAVDFDGSPTLAWSRYLGGTGTDELRGVAASSDGVFVTGLTTSNDLPNTSGTLSGPQDAVLMFVADPVGMPDGGVDAGTGTDAGVETDAGIEVDAGVEPDAGMEPDAGFAVDAGPSGDGGSVPEATQQGESALKVGCGCAGAPELRRRRSSSSS